MTTPRLPSVDLPTPGPLTIAGRWLMSSANWCAMLAAIAVLSAKVAGIISEYWQVLSLVAYIVGYQLGILLFGKPELRNRDFDDLLAPVELNLDREVIIERLGRLQHWVVESRRFSPEHVRSLTQLCEKITALLGAMENAKGISLEDSYSTRRLALEYLPALVHGYLSLPKDYASKKRLTGGMTAEMILLQNLQTLTQSVDEMAADLASQDAEAFLTHARFLTEKYGARDNLLG